MDSPEALQRSLLTLLGTVLLGIAFGLLASLGYGLVSRIFDRSPGNPASPWKPSPFAALLGGLIGFAVFHGIPALGLQPNLPGIIGAAQDFSARQNWWIYSVSCSLLGVLTFPFLAQFLKNKIQAPVISAALISLGCIALPFITGVPEYSKLSLAPEALRVRFAWMTLGTTALFWVFLNSTLAHFLNEPQKSTQ